MPKIGRPRGDLSKAVEAAIRAAGQAGMTLAELGEALPGDQYTSIKWAVSNLRDRSGFQRLIEGKLAVYYAPGQCGEEAYRLFRARVDEIKAASKAKSKKRTADYLARQAAAVRAARKGQVEEAQRLRQANKALAAKEAKERRELKAAQAEEKARLRAAQRAELLLSNRLAKRIKGDGTLRGAAKDVPVTVDMSQATITKIPRTPGRFEVLDSPGPFSSMRPGQYAFAASSCAARALG